jgi:hypothetical protein
LLLKQVYLSTRHKFHWTGTASVIHE